MIYRRDFLKTVGAVGTSLSVAKNLVLMADEQPTSDGGIIIDSFNPHSIVRMKDGSLMTEAGQVSWDSGRTWRKSEFFNAEYQKATWVTSILRLPNGELGTYYSDNDSDAAALGNESNNWHFRWSSDEGRSWSDPVQISLPGLTMGLGGTMFALQDGRLVVVTYSQFLPSRFDKRGASWGTYKGIRAKTETEGHYPQFEVTRVYYSDDNGRHWKPCDGWIIGWRDNKWSENFVEASGVELNDGRILLMERTLTGRLYQAFSEDRGHSWWPGAQPTALVSSYSPCRLARLPGTGDLVIIWNQVSRTEIRKGFRRARLSSAVSKDDGNSWQHFKNIESIRNLRHVLYLTPDPDFTPVWGDDEVGQLPEDFSSFSYPNLSFVGNEAFLSYGTATYEIGLDQEGNRTVKVTTGSRMRILPVEWFYT